MHDESGKIASVRRTDVLTSPGFVVGLSLLLLNDFALKPHFGNWLTGKLSDFAGLFIFPLFCAALLPRFRRAIYLLTAAAFALWKSSYSQPLIEAWNGLAVLPVGRTVDASDLWALFVLPFSFAYGGRAKRARARRLAPYLVAGLSLFAFTATSYRTEFTFDNQYRFPEPAAELTRKVYHLGHLDARYRLSFCARGGRPPHSLEVMLPADFCFNSADATIGIGEEQGQAVIALKRMGNRCPEGRDDKRKLLAVFETQFIERLKQVSLAPLGSAPGAEPSPSPTPPARPRGALYFVSVGETPDADLEGLASHFRKKYGVTVRVLPQIPLTDDMRSTDSPHSRPLAPRIIEAVARQYPRIMESRNDVLIAITEDMNAGQDGQIYGYTYDVWGRFAVVAVEALRPSTFCEPENRELLDARLRKAMAKNIGALYFDLPRSDDPRSLLYSNVGCVDELDYQSEDF